MDSIITGINNLLSWLGSIPSWFYGLFKDFLSSLFDMLGDVAAYILDNILHGVAALIGLIPVSTTTFNATTLLSGAPAEFIGMLIAIRVPEALGIVVAALGIRFLLGLIPFIRVGG